ncbi:hypothetical protein QSU92_03155 [Microbacterium sp. ET2]|uniref:hypothetical protein n=1 Tax=Microbacterium albipurpureum TaxID=3050384 RepID=UPI00259C9FDB|nr:hypothetical protein [Microbacterium sp. ET2 (Ac-2212)]WJL96216.1 hypothetical protein QSU92_03155 [Microbacterium sp. ET2 (Ac-2212)]
MTTSADTAVNAVLEIFSWVGLGLGGVVLLVAAILALADGTWEPVTVMIDDDDEGGRIARWFGSDGEVGEAHLTPEQLRALEGQDSASAFARRDSPGRMRLTRGSPLVRFVAWFGVGLAALGLLALVISWILLFTAG